MVKQYAKAYDQLEKIQRDKSFDFDPKNNRRNQDMANYVTQTSDKKKWTAFFLCLILGFLGAHRFYVGKIGSGILYLCTMGFFFIGILVDLISILLGSFRDNVGAPLRE
jgi:restriction system protein